MTSSKVDPSEWGSLPRSMLFLLGLTDVELASSALASVGSASMTSPVLESAVFRLLDRALAGLAGPIMASPW